MARTSTFEGPRRTLFLLGRDSVRIFPYEGGEALIPLRDCVGLLARLSSPPFSELGSVGQRSEAGEDELGRARLSLIPFRIDPDKAVPETSLSAGESLLVFENDSVLILGAEATEARFPVEDLRALLDFLAETPHIFSRRGPRIVMTDVLLPPEIPLLAPSEWLVFRAVQEARSPLVLSQIASRCPSLPPSCVAGIVERLVSRQLLRAQGAAWIAADVDLSALVDRMLSHWLASHTLGSPEQLSELVRLLDERISRPAPPH